MKYSATILALAAVATAQEFTSIFNITATPDQVVNASNIATPGQPGARGQFNYAINSRTNTICYDITLFGVSGNYQSPALTATHIHQANVGFLGPPRIAFPNPVGDDTIRRSSGCLTGPFTTGVRMADNVTDTGAGFTLAMIEANPANFFTDSHTNLYVPGVVRGQLSQSFRFLNDGSAITTATLTSTRSVTITSCPPTVVACPYTTAPLVTVTAVVYTTTCPISALPGYTSARSASTVVVVPATSVRTTVTSGAVVSTIVSTRAAATTTVPIAATATPVAPTASTTRPVFTGAASANKVGGVVLAAGIVAALL